MDHAPGDSFSRILDKKAALKDAMKNTDVGVRAKPKSTKAPDPEPTQSSVPKLSTESFKEYGVRLNDLQDAWKAKQ